MSKYTRTRLDDCQENIRRQPQIDSPGTSAVALLDKIQYSLQKQSAIYNYAPDWWSVKARF